MLPAKVIRCKKSKAVFTTQLVMISFLCGGELMSSLDHLHHYFLIIYVMLLPRMIHAVRNRRISLPDCMPHFEQRVRRTD